MAYTTIDDPSAHFQTLLWTGNGADNRALTNDANAGNFKPDWVWVKGRNQAEWHNVYDSNRGANKGLYTNSTYQEETLTETFESFDTDGFTVSYNSAYSSVFTNKNSTTYVAWQWKCNGGTTSTNNDGAVTSTVQVNSDAGFSILTYTMNSGSNETVGHGLGVTPDIIIYKARQRGDSNGFWHVYTTAYDGTLDYLKLNTLDAASNSSLSSPTSTTFVGGGSSTEAYRHFVAYCFAQKQGFSKVGTYYGNGNADGPFIYCGFKPKYVLIKPNVANNHWVVMDTARDEYNGGGTAYMFPNASEGEQTAYERMDFLSNGFKLRTNGGEWNGSGRHILYLAFAENPFVAGGVPTTAR